jgi:biotin transport system substrate-specific component
MSKEISVSLSAATSPATIDRPGRASSPAAAILRVSGVVAGGSLLAAVCAHVSIPLLFTPVPLSLAPFAVLLLGLLLTPRMAAATFGAYLLEGAAGLPVFAPVPAVSGVAHLFGPTGGYLLAYPLAAALISYLWRRTGRGYASALLCAAVGDLAILACGAMWLAFFTRQALLPVASAAVIPFLPGDALKVAATAAMAAGAVRLRRSRLRNV